MLVLLFEQNVTQNKQILVMKCVSEMQFMQ